MADTGSLRVNRHPILATIAHTDTIEITVNGRTMSGLEGDTIAAVMTAHGVRRFRTMPGSGTPRGYFCGAGRCSDCVVTVDGELNVLACTTTAMSGMVVTTQQGLGSWAEPE